MNLLEAIVFAIVVFAVPKIVSSLVRSHRMDADTGMLITAVWIFVVLALIVRMMVQASRHRKLAAMSRSVSDAKSDDPSGPDNQ